MPSKPSRPGQTGSAATQLVECTVRVSPALARIMRKIAEREASGVSAADALLEAVGLQPGELESLRKRLELASGEAKQWREKAERELAQIEHLKRAVTERNNEVTEVRDELRTWRSGQAVGVLSVSLGPGCRNSPGCDDRAGSPCQR